MGEFKPPAPGDFKKEQKKSGLFDRTFLDFQKDPESLDFFYAVFRSGAFGPRESLEKIIEGKHSAWSGQREILEQNRRDETQIFEMKKNAFWLYFEKKRLEAYQGDKEAVQGALMSWAKENQIDFFHASENIFDQSWKKYKEGILPANPQSGKEEKRKSGKRGESYDKKSQAAGELDWREENGE